jgi:hypothetical protein
MNSALVVERAMFVPRSIGRLFQPVPALKLRTEQFTRSFAQSVRNFALFHQRHHVRFSLSTELILAQFIEA